MRIRFLCYCSLVIGCVVASPLRADFLLVANTATGTVDEVSPSGTVSTYASGFNGLESLAVYNHNIFFVSSTGSGQGGGSISKLAGGQLSTFASGFSGPIGLAVDPSGNLFVVDQNDASIYKVTAGGTVSPFASHIANNLSFVTFDASGNLYASTAYGIDKITPDGTVSTFASNNGSTLTSPTGLAFDANGDLFVADSGTGLVDKITPAGQISTFASGFTNPQGLTFDSNGNLFVANMGTSINNGSISEVKPDGTVTTLVGGLNYPRGLADISPVPAPSNGILLLVLGLCVLAGYSWRWRKRVESAVKWEGF